MRWRRSGDFVGQRIDRTFPEAAAQRAFFSIFALPISFEVEFFMNNTRAKPVLFGGNLKCCVSP